MTARPQIIFKDGKPAFAVIPYVEYAALLKNSAGTPKSKDDEFLPFFVGDYIKNPIRLARIEAGLTQAQLAKRLKVTQGYISRIEGRNFKVTPRLQDRVGKALDRKK